MTILSGSSSRIYQREKCYIIARTYMERKKNFSGQSFWARGYHVSTVGRDEDMIKNYIKHKEVEDNRIDQLKLY